MYTLSADQLNYFLKHIKESYPKEGSGLLAGCSCENYRKLSFHGTPTEHNTAKSFRIKTSTIAEVSRSLEPGLEVCGCAHSHNYGPAIPSKKDFLANKDKCILWLIYSVPYKQLNLFEWKGDTFEQVEFEIKE